MEQIMFEHAIPKRPQTKVKTKPHHGGGSKPGKRMFSWDADEEAAMVKIAMQIAFDRINPCACDNRDFSAIPYVTKTMRLWLKKHNPKLLKRLLDEYAQHESVKDTTPLAKLDNAMYNRVHKAYYTDKDNNGRKLPVGDRRRRRLSKEHYRNNSKLVDLAPKAMEVYKGYLAFVVRLTVIP
jgi:hypothetical protein